MYFFPPTKENSIDIIIYSTLLQYIQNQRSIYDENVLIKFVFTAPILPPRALKHMKHMTPNIFYCKHFSGYICSLTQTFKMAPIQKLILYKIYSYSSNCPKNSPTHSGPQQV